MDSKQQILISNILVTANVMEIAKQVIKKVGLEYLPPLEDSVVEEQISKAIVASVKGA